LRALCACDALQAALDDAAETWDAAREALVEEKEAAEEARAAALDELEQAKEALATAEAEKEEAETKSSDAEFKVRSCLLDANLFTASLKHRFCNIMNRSARKHQPLS